MGFAVLGTVSAVFKSSYVRDMTLLSAADTGWWENICNHSNPQPPGPGRGPGRGRVRGRGGLATPRSRRQSGGANCSAWVDHTFGTLHSGSFDHILLANIKFWEPGGWSLPRLLSRMFGDYSSADC